VVSREATRQPECELIEMAIRWPNRPIWSSRTPGRARVSAKPGEWRSLADSSSVLVAFWLRANVVARRYEEISHNLAGDGLVLFPVFFK
jgi:hypothetical protein